jgi:hypothetical protein
MVKRYKGGLMGSTEATTSTSDARGMWGTVQATQARNTGNWAGLLATETPGSGSGAGFANAFMTVSNVAVTDSNYTILNDTPNISTAGGFIRVTGRGFVSGCVVYVGGVAATTTTFISSTEVRAQIAANTSNTLMVYVVNPDGSTGIKLSSLVFSGTPSWVTGETLTSQVTDIVFSISFAATSDSAVTYLLNTGSSLPPGTSLFANGLFTGTVTGLSSDTTYSFSVLANDAENQDTARTFSVTFGVGDSGFPLTSSLFNSDSNTWLRDASTNNAFISFGNDTRPTAFSPYNSNWSVLFNGSTDYLNATIGTLSGTWTVEFWVYMPTLGVQYTFTNFNTGGNGGINIWRNTSNQLVVDDGANAQTAFSTVTFAIASVWYHVAVTRDGTTTRGYINGVLAGTNTFTPASVTAVTIGRYNANPFYYLSGYMSSLRIVDGVVVYTGAFTPPTTALPATQSAGTNIAAITAGQTLLLTLQNNRFIDANATPKTITVNGTPQVTSFAPFAETDTTTGSAYFDGTGDYLIITDNAGMELGAGDFCVECWIYTTTNSGTGIVIDKRSASYGPLLIWRNLGNLQLYMSGNGSSWSIVNGTTMLAMTTHTWYHVAVYRVGTAVYYSINGTATSVATSSATPVNNATNWYIGTETNGSTNPWTGWIADMRFVVGSSPYGATAFTPPVQSLSAIANTQFLSLQYRIGENNHRFVDESGLKHLITRTGEVHQGSYSPFSPAGWSHYFDGSSYYDFTASTTFNEFLTGDFTVECWLYYTGTDSFSGNPTALSVVATWSTSVSYEIEVQSSGVVRFAAGDNIPIDLRSSGAGLITANAWYHVAAARASGVTRLFINGANVAAHSGSVSISQAATNMRIGGFPGGGNRWTGYISDLRIVKGQAAYTANFTPATSSLSTTSQSITSANVFLGCNTNRFIDANTTPKTISSFTSAPRVQAFSPFRATGSYSPTLHGGSAYFDGSGDYLDLTGSTGLAFGTGDWTIEFWVYTNTVAGDALIYDSRPASTNGAYPTIYRSGATIKYFTSSADRITSAAVLVVASWCHIAVARISGTTRMYINGIVQTATYTDSTTYLNGASRPRLGDSGVTVGSGFSGYISGLRVVKSQGTFTGNFAIPTAPPGLTQTSSTNVAAITSNVTMLTNFTHAGIIDHTARNNIYTFTGTNIRSSNVQSKFGTGSLFFTGGYQYAFIGPGNNSAYPPLLPTIGDYTVEFWVYATASDTTLMCLNTTLSVFAAVRLQVNANGSVTLLVSTSSANVINVASSAATFAYNTWQHIAVVRNGGTHSVYINGTSRIASTTIAATTAVQGGVESVLGCIDNRNNSDFASFFQGYIDDFRTSRFARYTANFTAPTSAHLTR